MRRAPRPAQGWRAARWWRTGRWWLAAAAAVATLVVVQLLATPSYSDVPWSPSNRGDQGMRALAQVLRQQGVDVVEVGTPSAAARALARSAGSATLLVTHDTTMTDAQLATLPGDASHVVLMAPSEAVLARLAPGVRHTGSAGPDDAVPAGCDDPDARAAGSLAQAGAGLVSTAPAAVSCFGSPGDAAMVRVDDVTVLGSAAPFTNAAVLQAGNAALGLRLLGKDPTLVWLTPDPALLAAESGSGSGPRTAWIVVLLLLFVLLVWWRAPRLGPLVAEPLPVVVRSDEVTVGRARLYRRSRAAAHAAALVRAGTVDRVAGTVGLATHSGPDHVVAAIARAAGRDPHEVRSLLYGPAPTTTAALADLTTALDQLAREVRRP